MTIRMDRRGNVKVVRPVAKKSRSAWVDREVDRYRAGLLTLEGLAEAVLSELGWKYDESQPRVPAGSSEGGRWTNAGGGVAQPETTTVVGQEVEYWHVGPGQIVSKEDQRLFDRDGAAVLLTPDDELYVSSRMLHADLVDMLGDTKNYDNYTRVLVSGGGIRASSIDLGTYQRYAKGRGSRQLTDEEKAKIDNAAARKLQKVASRLLGAGFPGGKYVQWRMVSGVNRVKIEGTLSEFAEGAYKEFDPGKGWLRSWLDRLLGRGEDEKQATPRGSALPPWEGQVEITPEDVADAIRDWDRKAPKAYRGLLLTERPEEGG